MAARSRIAALAALLAGCASPLDLPPEPTSADAPHVDRIEPDVAIASLGSPLLIHGTHLAQVTDVFIGPLHLRARAIEATDTNLLVHVNTAQLVAAGIADVDGDDELVKVVSPGGTDTALAPVRVYATLATIDEITPTDLAAHQLVYLRGRGFDGATVDDNLVALARPDVAQACADADAQLGQSGPPVCVKANVFWAAKGLVIAEVPDGAPSGSVQVVYKNLQFEKLAAEAEAWRQSGRDLSSFYEGGDTTGPSVSGANSESDAAAVGSAATSTVRDPGAPEDATVWEDPGLLTAAARPGGVALTGEGRLCYRLDGPAAGPTDRLQVLIDGAAMPNDALRCAADDDDTLLVTLPADGARGTHSVQVVNPFFQSPLAFFSN